MSSHIHIREGDEIMCPKCGKRWAIDEQPPLGCISNYRLLRNKSLNKIRRLRHELFGNDRA